MSDVGTLAQHVKVHGIHTGKRGAGRDRRTSGSREPGTMGSSSREGSTASTTPHWTPTQESSGRCSQWETKSSGLILRTAGETRSWRHGSGWSNPQSVQRECRQQDSPQTSCSNTLSPPRCLLTPPITQNLVHTVEAHVIRSVARISYFTQEELNARNEQIPLSVTKVCA